ncbi:primosomal replication protein [Shewanella sp. SR44-3]|uniref:primosomal replication protein n=1 Tax=Shewanella sp. SR44-3 TaxID=2760936 RepID=UPI0015FE321E|nr:primosomal replication protein [Shewanella sp. SR44-3]MBB1270140.1 primosomal replication protein [Shewanella sp. SR44-3]
MNNNQVVANLRAKLAQLEQEVLQHDANIPVSQGKLLQDVERFNNQLFIQQGAKLSPCIEQLKKSINQLEKQLSLKLDAQLITLSCERVQDRFTALKRALNTTNINIKSAEQQKNSKRAFFAKRQQSTHASSGFGWIAGNVMQNSHELYAELNKHLNWADKITQKIAQMELNLASCHPNDKIALQNEILATHKRLGKCRQAMSYIEERIQLLERPHYSDKR